MQSPNTPGRSAADRFALHPEDAAQRPAMRGFWGTGLVLLLGWCALWMVFTQL